VLGMRTRHHVTASDASDPLKLQADPFVVFIVNIVYLDFSG